MTVTTFPVEFRGQYAAIPVHMQEAIRKYVNDGVQPGDFLTAVITNDLRRAVGHADDQNLSLLKLYVQWFYNEAPSVCWGSNKNMDEWLNARSSEFVTP